MCILVLCDDYWHPASTVRNGLGTLGDGDFAFDWIEDAREWSADRMMEYPVVVLAKSNNISASDRSAWASEEAEEAFGDYVRKGNGLLIIHSGTAGYRQMPTLRGLMGGAFVRHPEQCPVTIEPKEGHLLAAGSAPFTLVDEHYFMDMDDDQVDLFLTTTSEHGTQPGGWTRREGEGRVCVMTPGHNEEVWLHPSFQALLRNALRWCGKMM
ncbi:MAG: hypothetical protein A2Y73_05920 [Chloroflexi bacterium RBG_13_56_8]|nr:MAG: hypothetical protein A2Y73_05920 [Chloroflexi bacterium RBG_13_56_8]